MLLHRKGHLFNRVTHLQLRKAIWKLSLENYNQQVSYNGSSAVKQINDRKTTSKISNTLFLRDRKKMMAAT